MKTRKEIMLELANEHSAIQITELKEEIEHLKSKLQQIEQLADELVQTKIPFCQIYQRANNIEGRYEHCKDVCELNGDNYFYCKMNNNCYYKQLKRKEQECRRLNLKIIELKAMNETLKNECVNCKELNQLKASKEQAEQKLERIGDIAEKDRNFCLKCNGGKEIGCIDCIEGGRALLAKEILQIIDEVE